MKKVLLMAVISLAALSCNKTEKTTIDTTVDGTTANTGMTTDSMTTAPMATEANAAGDAETAKKFMDGSMMEVRMGNLAQQNGSSAKVKEFGKMMVTDHTKTGEELKALATKKGWTVPTELSAEKKAKYDEMAAKKGADFDKAYAKFMVEDHKEDIEKYTKASTSAMDADMKAYASKTLPTLEHHLKMAQEAETAVK